MGDCSCGVPHSRLALDNRPSFRFFSSSSERISHADEKPTAGKLENKQSTNLSRFLLSFSSSSSSGQAPPPTSLLVRYRLLLLEGPKRKIKQTLQKYGDAAELQLAAFWREYGFAISSAGGVVAVVATWQALLGLATLLGIELSGLGQFSLLLGVAASVASVSIGIRVRNSIHPDISYLLLLKTLNLHAGVLEVMGAPIVGSKTRLYIVSPNEGKGKEEEEERSVEAVPNHLQEGEPAKGGRERSSRHSLFSRASLESLLGTNRMRRCFLSFPIRGAERQGVAVAEVNKQNGKYDIKLLAVDLAPDDPLLPPDSGADWNRLYVVGKEHQISSTKTGAVLDTMRKALLFATGGKDWARMKI